MSYLPIYPDFSYRRCRYHRRSVLHFQPPRRTCAQPAQTEGVASCKQLLFGTGAYAHQYRRRDLN